MALIETVPTYDWKLTLKKALVRMGVSAGLIFCAAAISALNSGAVPPKYIYLVPVAHALLAAINNLFKHAAIDAGPEAHEDGFY